MPIPALIGAVARGASAVGRGAGAMGASGAASKISNFAGHIAQVGFAAQSAGGMLGALGQAFIPLAPHISVLTGALNVFKSAVTSIGDAVGGFVQLASPIHVVKFNLAVEDMVASIGKILIPVMEYGTSIVRMFADVIFALSSPLQGLMRAFFQPLLNLMPSIQGVFMALGHHVENIVRVLTPIVNIFGKLFEAFSKVGLTILEAGINVAAILVEIAQGPIMIFLTMMEQLAVVMLRGAEVVNKFLRNLFGLKDVKTGGSVGAAARPAQITSIEEYGRKAQQAAFSLGTAADPAVETMRTTKDIYTILATLMEKLKNFPAEVAIEIWKAYEAIKGRLGDKAREAGRYVDSGRRHIVGEIEGTLGITLPGLR